MNSLKHLQYKKHQHLRLFCYILNEKMKKREVKCPPNADGWGIISFAFLNRSSSMSLGCAILFYEKRLTSWFY